MGTIKVKLSIAVLRQNKIWTSRKLMLDIRYICSLKRYHLVFRWLIIKNKLMATIYKCYLWLRMPINFNSKIAAFSYLMQIRKNCSIHVRNIISSSKKQLEVNLMLRPMSFQIALLLNSFTRYIIFRDEAILVLLWLLF